MEHADSKSKNVAALWRVFSILLETCCKADYKMLIQSVIGEHKKEMDDVEAAYNQKFAA